MEQNPLRHIENIVLLRNTPIFGGLAPSQLQRLVMTAHEHHYGGGEKIAAKGTAFTALYIVKEGQCRIGAEQFDHGQTVREESVFVPNCTLEDDMCAVGECTVVTINQSVLYETLLHNPSTAVRIIESFAGVIAEGKKYRSERI